MSSWMPASCMADLGCRWCVLHSRCRGSGCSGCRVGWRGMSARCSSGTSLMGPCTGPAGMGQCLCRHRSPFLCLWPAPPWSLDPCVIRRHLGDRDLRSSLQRSWVHGAPWNRGLLETSGGTAARGEHTYVLTLVIYSFLGSLYSFTCSRRAPLISTTCATLAAIPPWRSAAATAAASVSNPLSSAYTCPATSISGCPACSNKPRML